MTVMKEKVATIMAAHDRMKNMWVLAAMNTDKDVLLVSHVFSVSSQVQISRIFKLAAECFRILLFVSLLYMQGMKVQLI